MHELDSLPPDEGTYGPIENRSRRLPFEGLKLVLERRKERKREKELNYPAFRPLNDRGGSISSYEGPSGPIVTLARIMENHRKGRPLNEGIPNGALNDPNSP